MTSKMTEGEPSRVAQLGTIVVTGACGFIGANICRYFAGRGVSVCAIDGPSGSDWRLKGAPNMKRVKLELRSRSDVRDFIASERPAVVINCAAFGAYPVQSDPDRIYDVNFHAVRFLLESVQELPGFAAFIQAGSSSEYGLNCAGPEETSATLPDSHYAVSKVSASALTQLYGMKHQLPAWVFRLYSVYGPYEDFSRLIPKLLLCARKRKLPDLVDPTISRDFVFVEDVCRAIELLLVQASDLKRGEIYNIGTGLRTSIGDLVAVVRQVFRVTDEPVWGSMRNRHWDHPDWFSDSRKAKRELRLERDDSIVRRIVHDDALAGNNAPTVAEGQQSSVKS